MELAQDIEPEWELGFAEEMKKLFEECGFDTSPSEIWAMRVWTGKPFKSFLVSIMCLSGVWSVSPMVGEIRWVPWSDPMEEVVELVRGFRKLFPGEIEWIKDGTRKLRPLVPGTTKFWATCFVPVSDCGF